MREARNCDGQHPSDVLCFEWDLSLKRCPWSIVDQEVMAYFELWRDWKMLGALPYDGGLMDQPLHVFQAIKICETTSVEAQNRQLRALNKSGGTDG